MSSLIEEYPEQLLKANMFKKYSHGDFNNIKHIHESAKIEVVNAACTVGNLLRKHKLNDLLGVCRVHNHFHLKENEIVESKFVENDGKFSTKVDSPYAIYLQPIDLTLNKIAKPIPYLWAYNMDSKMFFAIQFFDGSNEKMMNRFRNMCNRTEKLVQFYNEFIIVIENLGMEDDLGIFLLHNDLFFETEKEGLFEITDEPNRKQWVFSKSKAKYYETTGEVTTTLWNFSKDAVQVTHCESCSVCACVHT